LNILRCSNRGWRYGEALSRRLVSATLQGCREAALDIDAVACNLSMPKAASASRQESCQKSNRLYDPAASSAV